MTYDEFVRGVRGEMDENRRAMVKLAFQTLDERGEGVVTLEDILKKLNTTMMTKTTKRVTVTTTTNNDNRQRQQQQLKPLEPRKLFKLIQ